MKTSPKVGQLLVVSMAPDATLYRVVSVEGFKVEVIDAALAATMPNLATQWHDRVIFKSTKRTLQGCSVPGCEGSYNHQGACTNALRRPPQRKGAAKLALASMTREQLESANRASVQPPVTVSTGSIEIASIARSLWNAKPTDLLTNQTARHAWYDCVGEIAKTLEGTYPKLDLAEFFDIAGVPS